MVTGYKTDNVNRFFRVSVSSAAPTDASPLDSLGISMSTWRHPQPQPCKHKCCLYTRHRVLKDPAQHLHLLDFKNHSIRSFRCTQDFFPVFESNEALLRNHLLTPKK